MQGNMTLFYSLFPNNRAQPLLHICANNLSRHIPSPPSMPKYILSHLIVTKASRSYSRTRGNDLHQHSTACILERFHKVQPTQKGLHHTNRPQAGGFLARITFHASKSPSPHTNYRYSSSTINPPHKNGRPTTGGAIPTKQSHIVTPG